MCPLLSLILPQRLLTGAHVSRMILGEHFNTESTAYVPLGGNSTADQNSGEENRNCMRLAQPGGLIVVVLICEEYVLH